MPKMIEVEDDVFRALQELAEPLIDSPNSVLRRILRLRAPAQETDSQPLPPHSSRPRHSQSAPDQPAGDDKADESARSQWSDTQERPKRARRGTLLAETEYFRPILEAIDEFGGSTAASRVIDRVGHKLESRFTEADRGLHDSGGMRWRKRTQFARLTLVNKGLMRSDSPHGLWEISDAGRAFLRQEASK